ncbi:MAG: alpha/beta fold hydrolase [Beijerinckiaceae bacterium]
MPAFIDNLHAAYFAFADNLRRAQANALDAFGLGPRECTFQVISSGPGWRLRDYAGPAAEPPLLIVSSPIKRPYIWDLTPSVSAVRYCLDHGLHVYLLEWTPPAAGNGHAGLDEYIGQAIAACVTTISNTVHGTQPFLIGHSLGGALAAIFCAAEPHATRGLVLLSTPLCFEQASSGFRDALVSLVPSGLPETDVVAGSLLSHVSAAASPKTFLWSRWKDAALSLADPSALEIHARIERWSLDEVALPAKLVNQIVQWLYRENRLCRGTLSIGGRTLGPTSLQIPTLAIVNTGDEIAPLASIAPFIDKIENTDTRIIEYPGEVGVVLQHLGMLVGREAFARIWPQIISWLASHN